MKQQHLLSLVRQAVQAYDMIDDNDKIAVGISGGKDSLILAYALGLLRKFYPKKFELIAITVNVGFDDFNVDKVKEFMKEIDVPYHVVDTQIYDIVFVERKEANPCSLCSKMRKAALFNYAEDMGFNKIALGHNKDDINETLLMSLFFAGCIHTMPPVNHLDNSNVTIIRPLIYVKENDIRSYVTKNNFPVVKSPCPADGKTKREDMKNVIAELKKLNKRVPDNIFGAIERSSIEGWGIKK